MTILEMLRMHSCVCVKIVACSFNCLWTFLLLVSSEWPGLPAGVKFEPSDEELLYHLSGKCCVHMLLTKFNMAISVIVDLCTLVFTIKWCFF